MWREGGKLSVAGLLLSGLFTMPCFAQTSPNEAAPKSAFKDNLFSRFEPRFSGDLRLRYQHLQRDSFAEDGQALTLRFHGALEAKIFDKTYILGEVESVTAGIVNFNDGTGRQPQFPFIPDPEGLELNRLQIISEAIPKTRITAGRQRLALDDWRFIGAFPFRQNSQTIDALRVETKAIGSGVLDAGYFNKVRRPLGADNNNGVFSGDSYFLNYNLATPFGRFAAFHYALDLETGTDLPRQNASSQTTGARILGRRDWDNISLVWAGSYARQSDYANSPIEYAADYMLAELSALPGPFEFKVRGEILGSDNGHAVQTPLASLHKFQGFADKFLSTPDEGVRDYSVFAQYDFGALGPFSNIEGFARHHWFEADTNGRNYGRELNLSLKAKVRKTSFSLEYANYKAETFSDDTQALFLTSEISF